MAETERPSFRSYRLPTFRARPNHARNTNIPHSDEGFQVEMGDETGTDKTDAKLVELRENHAALMHRASHK